MSYAEWKEPPLTCPVIDAFIADQNPPQAVVDQLGEIRDINSQLRYGTWHLKEALATKAAEIARLREALNGKFCALFLDGRNEHGWHVLPSFPTSIDITPEDLNSDCAEEILKTAEAQGFSIGDMVWAEFEWVPDQVDEYGRAEFEGYWEFKRINAEMTRIALYPAPDPAGGMPVEVET